MFLNMESSLPANFNVPDVNTKTQGPAILIIPIAIYS